MKLLLVEDDKEGAAYLKRALAEAGHTVDCAAAGRETADPAHIEFVLRHYAALPDKHGSARRRP